MFTTSRPALRKVAAGSALALAATGGAFLASPASAESALLNYTCSFPLLGDKALTATHAIDVAEVPYGGMVPITTTMNIPADVTGALYGFVGARQVDGTATVKGIANGLVRIAVEETIPKTDVPAEGGMSVIAKGGQSLAPYAGAAPAGATVEVDLVDLAEGGGEQSDIDAVLYTYDAEGAKGGPFNVPCELTDDQVLDVGSVTVVQAATETTAKLAYKAKKKKLVATALTDAPDSQVAAAGDVTFIVKRNGKNFAKDTVALKDEKAVFKVPAPKKGTYKVITKYLGDSNFVKSKDAATKTV